MRLALEVPNTLVPVLGATHSVMPLEGAHTVLPPRHTRKLPIGSPVRPCVLEAGTSEHGPRGCSKTGPVTAPLLRSKSHAMYCGSSVNRTLRNRWSFFSSRKAWMPPYVSGEPMCITAMGHASHRVLIHHWLLSVCLNAFFPSSYTPNSDLRVSTIVPYVWDPNISE